MKDGELHKMSYFNQLLDKYIERSDISVRKLSEKSGFSRPYISGMRSGKIPSPDYEKIKILISLLNLSIYEEKELLDAYWSARIGKEDERIFTIAQDMIERIDCVYDSNIQSHYQHVLPNYQNITGEADVLLFARMLFENQNNSTIKILLPGIKREFYNMLSQVLRMNDSIVVEHIFCLDNEKKSRCINNMKVLNNLIYCILSGPCYESYYYYDDFRPNIWNGILPYCIITENQIMLISADYRNAYLSSDNAMKAVYEKRFDEIKKRCSVFVQPIVSIEEYLQIWSQFMGFNSESDNQAVNIEYEPCVALSIPDWVVNNMLTEADFNTKAVIKDYLAYISQLENVEIINCFKLSGLQEFIETGRIAALPFDVYKPCTTEEKIAVLEAYIDATKSENLSARVIDDQTIHMPDDFQVSTNPNGDVIMQYQEKSNGMIYQLNEPYSKAGISKFIRYFEHSRFVKTEQETMEILYEAVEQLKEQACFNE